MASLQPSPLFSLIPQNPYAEALVENSDYASSFWKLPDPLVHGLCVKFDPTSPSGLDPSFLGTHNGTDVPTGEPFRFMLNINNGEVLLEDYSDGQAFKFTGPTALTFPNPPHPRRLIIDCRNNLEFECIYGSEDWSKWKISWHQERPVNVSLWERGSTGPRTGVMSPMLTNDDGYEVSTEYKQIPDSNNGLICHADRSWQHETQFGAPGAVVDIRTGQHLAIKTVSTRFRNHDRQSLEDKIIRSCKLSHPNIIAFLQVQTTPTSIDIIMPWKDGNLLWFIQQNQNQPDMFRTPTEADQPGQLLFDQILGQMLSALEYLESQIVVHRYICPGNILVKTSSNERGHSFYVSNFEYESFNGATFEPSEVCSRAPEECGLTDAQVSPQTDIWGLSATMAYVFDLPGFRDLLSSRPSAIDLAQAVCEKSRMLVSLQGMGEWHARDRPSAGRKLVELFGEPSGRG